MCFAWSSLQSGFGRMSSVLSTKWCKIKISLSVMLLYTFCLRHWNGATQTAQHVRRVVSVMLICCHWINRRHVPESLGNKTREQPYQLICAIWITQNMGLGKSVAGDGIDGRIAASKNLISEFLSLSTTTVVGVSSYRGQLYFIFSTFMPCGVWEAVEISGSY